MQQRRWLAVGAAVAFGVLTGCSGESAPAPAASATSAAATSVSAPESVTSESGATTRSIESSATTGTSSTDRTATSGSRTGSGTATSRTATGSGTGTGTATSGSRTGTGTATSGTVTSGTAGGSGAAGVAGAVAAIEAAEGAVPGGRAFDVEEEILEGQPVWEIKVATEGQQSTVYVVADGSSVVSQEEDPEPDDDVAKLLSAEISAPEALRTAVEQGNGTLSELEIDATADGTIVWQIDLRRADGTVVQVLVDAATGEVVSTSGG